MQERRMTGNFQNDSFPFSMTFARKESGNLCYPLPFYRMIFLHRGSIALMNRSERRNLGISTCIFLPPVTDSPPYQLIAERDTFCTVITISRKILDHLHLSSWENIFFQDSIYPFLEMKENNLPRISSLEERETVEMHLKQLYREYTLKPEAFEIMILQYLTQLLVYTFRSGKQNDKQSNHQWIQRIKDYLHKHCTDNICLKDLSEIFHMNSAYLSTTFKQKTGMALFEFINHLRIRKACILLKRSEQSIIDIAYAVGYNNVSFFNRYFRRITQMSPREYRNSIKQ